MLSGITNKFRVVIAALGFIGALTLPPFVPLLVMVALSLRFAAWEVIAIGALVDVLWFTPSSEGLIGAFPLFTLIGLALAWGLEPLRRELLT